MLFIRTSFFIENFYCVVFGFNRVATTNISMYVWWRRTLCNTSTTHKKLKMNDIGWTDNLNYLLFSLDTPNQCTLIWSVSLMPNAYETNWAICVNINYVHYSLSLRIDRNIFFYYFAVLPIFNANNWQINHGAYTQQTETAHRTWPRRGENCELHFIFAVRFGFFLSVSLTRCSMLILATRMIPINQC